MINKICKPLVICLLSLPVCSFAESTTTVPKSALFAGLGGSFNSALMNETDNLIGVSNVLSGSTVVATGTAQGPTAPFNITQTTFAPNAQIGYFHFFPASNWLGGIKFTSSYINTTFSENNIPSPQAGNFTNISGTNTFTGHATIGSMQTTINQKLSLMPFFGRSFGNGFFYLGVAPTLINAQSNIYNVVGYADINGTHMDVSGTPQNFSSKKWVWGGDAQIGITYYLTPCWFVDFSYSYAVTANYTTNYSSPFSSTSGGFTTSGMLIGNTQQRLTVQSVMATLNAVLM